ncbi:MAG: hypothetical protein ACE5DX_05890, partial [Candidatus Dojkabacteria bacterium]
MPQLIKPDKILIVLLTTVVVIVLLHLNMHEVRVLGKTESIFYLDEQITLGAYFVAVGAAVAGVLHLQA